MLAFGAFDPLHEGHHYFFSRAREIGDYLLVIVARDSAIREDKKREPGEREEVRLKRVAASDVDEARLGDERPMNDPYRLLGELEFDVLALGYDQKPDEATVRQELNRRGKERVKIVRMGAFRPELYKSSYRR